MCCLLTVITILFFFSFSFFVLCFLFVAGPVVNRSARVSDTGHGGQIVCTQEVVDALRSNLSSASSPSASSSSSTSSPYSDIRLNDVSLTPLISDMGCHSLKGI